MNSENIYFEIENEINKGSKNLLTTKYRSNNRNKDGNYENFE